MIDFFQPVCFAADEQLLSSSDSSLKFKSENVKFAIVTADRDFLRQNLNV